VYVYGRALDAEIEHELLAGQKIAAVRRYRALTGAPFPAARSTVDAIEERLRQAGRLPPPPGRTWLSYAALTVVIAGGLVVGIGVFLLLMGLRHAFPLAVEIEALIALAGASAAGGAAIKRRRR
jgi:hypothetical protein